MRMYPRRWRERYGEEFEDFLIEGRGDLRTWVDVIRAAVGEHVHPIHMTRIRRRDERSADDKFWNGGEAAERVGSP